MKTKSGWGSHSSKWFVRYEKNAEKSSRRQYLKSKILELEPSSILEFGCASCCNLQLYNKDLSLAGVDANKWAIDRAKKEFPHILTQEVDITKPFDLKNTYDIVFSMGVLIHICPKDIRQVLDNMIFHAKKYIVLCEGHVEKDWQKNANGIHYRAFYNYGNLLPGIKIQKLPEPRDKSAIAANLHLMIYEI